MTALNDIFNNNELQITPELANTIVNATMNGAKKHEENMFIQENAQFLVENAKREEVHVTESGLQYEIIKESNGKKP